MPKKINPAFGQCLKAIREAASTTQQELSEKSGVPLGTLREIEQGRREPLFGVVQRIANVLNFDMKDLPSTTIEDS